MTRHGMAVAAGLLVGAPIGLHCGRGKTQGQAAPNGVQGQSVAAQKAECDRVRPQWIEVILRRRIGHRAGQTQIPTCS